MNQPIISGQTYLKKVGFESPEEEAVPFFEWSFQVSFSIGKSNKGFFFVRTETDWPNPTGVPGSVPLLCGCGHFPGEGDCYNSGHHNQSRESFWDRVGEVYRLWIKFDQFLKLYFFKFSSLFSMGFLISKNIFLIICPTSSKLFITSTCHRRHEKGGTQKEGPKLKWRTWQTTGAAGPGRILAVLEDKCKQHYAAGWLELWNATNESSGQFEWWANLTIARTQIWPLFLTPRWAEEPEKVTQWRWILAANFGIKVVCGAVLLLVWSFDLLLTRTAWPE